MKIHTLAVLLISSLNPLFSSPSSEGKLPLSASETVDTRGSLDLSNWITVPFAHKYRSTAQKEAGEERVEIRFPSMPTPILPTQWQLQDPDYNRGIILTITDETGTTFTLDPREIGDFGQSGLDGSYEWIYRQATKSGGTLITSTFKSGPDFSTFRLTWTQNNKLFDLMGVQSQNFIYFIKADTTQKEMYRYFDPLALTAAEAREYSNDLQKSEAFLRSFVILE